MHRRDYYEVLGLERSADTGQIKRAYRQRALEYHPDRNPGDPAAEEKFKEASEAYEVLSDPQKRQIYDQFGHTGLEGRGFHGFDRVDDIFASFGSLFEDMFGADFFGGFGGRRRGRGYQEQPRRGADLEASVHTWFEEMVAGVKKEIEIHKEGVCATCFGKGTKSGKRETCATCGGSGQVAHTQGFFMIQTVCPRCRGEGTFIADPCDDCRGAGRVRQKKKLSVRVPPGVEDGMRLVLRGEGHAGSHGGPGGDLFVLVRVEPHPFFERKEDDIHCTVPVSLPQAALGAKIKVPTLDGDQEIKIPEGTDSGEEVRLKKMGVPNVHNGKRGDQIVHIRVETPKKLSKKQRQLLEEFLKVSS